jgi:uncharacterized protein YqhQ
MDKNKKCPVGGKGIGGQAVIEGVMMRGKRIYAHAVRNSKGGISIEKTPVKPATDKSKIFGFPIVRGVVAFIDSLVMGMKVTTKSAEMAGLDDIEYDEESKFEKWLEEKCGDKLKDYIIYFSVAVSLVLAFGLFSFLPTFIGGLIGKLMQNDSTNVRSIVESITKMVIFLGYLSLVSCMKDIKRVFMYHGAEHKTINCFESGDELTVENVRKHTRLHKRCGTSFLVIVMIISIFLGFFIRTNVFWLRVVCKLLLIPIISGISYEIIKWAGSHDNWLVNIVSAPGIATQYITTREPKDEMIEVAIASLNAVLEEEPEDK